MLPRGPSALCCSADVHLPTNVAATQTETPGIYPPVCRAFFLANLAKQQDHRYSESKLLWIHFEKLMWIIFCWLRYSIFLGERDAQVFVAQTCKPACCHVNAAMTAVSSDFLYLNKSKERNWRLFSTPNWLWKSLVQHYSASQLATDCNVRGVSPFLQSSHTNLTSGNKFLSAQMNVINGGFANQLPVWIFLNGLPLQWHKHLSLLF